MSHPQLNRITKADYPTDTDIVYVYDGNNKTGTLNSVTDAVGTINFIYDNRLRKIQEQRIVDGMTWTSQYTFDALDRIIGRINPDNTSVSFTYNIQGEVESASGVVSGIDYNTQ